MWWQVSNLSKLEKKQTARDVFPVAGRTRTHRAGLGAPFLGCARVELPLPLRPLPHSSPPTPHLLSLLHLCLKNTFLDTHKPSIPLPDPTEMHISVLKPCFSTVNCLEKDRCLCPFLIFHSWGGERTIADVNTGNDTNEQIGNKKKKESKLLAWNELVIAGVFSQCENSQLR